MKTATTIRRYLGKDTSYRHKSYETLMLHNLSNIVIVDNLV